MANTSYFSRSMLDGMQPGMSRLASALIGGDQAYKLGQDDAELRRARLAQLEAQTMESRAKADRSKAEAEAASPYYQTRRAMMANGVPLNAQPDVQTFLDEGRIDKYAMPENMQGPTMPAPDWAAPQNLGRVAQMLAGLGAVAAGEAKGQEDYFKGQNQQAETALARAIVDGKLPQDAAGRGMALMKATPLYKIPEGYTGNQYTGGIDIRDPVNAGKQGLVSAQAGQARAAAADHYAGVGEKNARTTQIKQETVGGGKAPAGYRWSPDGQSLIPIPGGPAVKEPTEGERKAGSLLMRLRGSQAQMLGAVGLQASAEKPIPAAEFVRQIPLIGGDTAANLLTPEARQQVEAAQLDMLDAALTLGTGAAYTKEQLRGYAKSYFPQIGDKPQTLADKKVRLANVIRAAEIAAGRAAGQAIPDHAGSAPAGRSVTVDY